MIWLACVLVGAGTGGVTAGLLHALAVVTDLRSKHAELFYLLAPAGLLTGFLYRSLGRTSAGGTVLIIDEIHEPRAPIPARMAPLIFFCTTLTHLVGGSAGREGSAVQIGGAGGDWLARVLKVKPSARRTLLAAGLAAGFAGAVGAPLAGATFGLEVLGRGAWRRFAWPHTLAAAGASTLVTHWLHAPHGHYPAVTVDLWRFSLWPVAVTSGVAFGLAARSFTALTHGVGRVFARAPLDPAWRPALGGALLSVLFVGGGLTRYAGLGLDVIGDALTTPASFVDPVVKVAMTALTLGAGFKGGEFIPLVFVGTTLGSALAPLFPATPLAPLGFAAVFGAAARTPVASAIMAAELFGGRMLGPALACGFAASAVSGSRGIYGSKRLGSPTKLS